MSYLQIRQHVSILSRLKPVEELTLFHVKSNVSRFVIFLKCLYQNDVQEDLRETGIEGWRKKTQDRDQWRRIAQEAKAYVGL